MIYTIIAMFIIYIRIIRTIIVFIVNIIPDTTIIIIMITSLSLLFP